MYDFAAFAGSINIKAFNGGFILEFHYTDDQIAGLDEGTLRVYFWDETQNIWAPLPNLTLDPANNTITVFTDHLTLFAIFSVPAEAGGGSTSYITPGPTVEKEEPEAEEEKASEEEVVPKEEDEVVPKEEAVPEEVPTKEAPLAEEREKGIPEVSEVPIGATLTRVLNEDKRVYPGDDLLVLGRIIRFEPKEEIILSLHYQIRNEDDALILDHTETMAVKTRVTFEKTFHIAEEARLGTYTISLAILDRDTFISSVDTFEIVERSLFDIIPEPVLILPEEGTRGPRLALSAFFIAVLLALGLWNWKRSPLENPK